jgi:hypothetical protein
MSLSKSASRIPMKDRSPASLNSKLDRKLFAYATAATAAGASILALAQPSQAEIVFTPTHKMVPMNKSVALDLNGDGITDFTFRNTVSSCGLHAAPPECSNFTFQGLEVYGNSALNGAWAAGTRGASALPPGKKVGPGVKFTNYGALESCATFNGFSEGSYGPWLNVQNRYLGLAFTIDGQIHYGWARLTVTVKQGKCRPATAVLTGYAYETVAGMPITTGKRSGAAAVSAVEPPRATLGMLAQGCVWLEAWRRDDEASSGQV